MKFTFYHNNINVLDLEKSVAFYQKLLALLLPEKRRPTTEVSSWYSWVMETLPSAGTYLAQRYGQALYLGDNEFHLAMRTDDMDAAHALHEEMGCICFENPDMGIYFISDPDGYWIEICPADNESRLDQQNAVSGRLCF